jgi:hypothetical protein
MRAARQLDIFRSKRQRGRAPPPPHEFPVHCMIADTLKRWASPGWVWTHPPNGGERARRQNPRTGSWYSPEGQRLARMGTRPGVSDFLLVGPPAGRLHALELKREGEEPSEEQARFLIDVQAAGGAAAWVDSYPAAIRQLQAWGALPSTIRSF